MSRQPVAGIVRHLILLPLAVGLLVSCSTPQTRPDAASQATVDEREAQLQALQEFSFEGGLGIWTDEQSLSARIKWLQSADTLEVDMNGPLGIGNMRLNQTDGSASLYRGEVMLASGPSANVVLQQGLALEAPVPLDQIQLWVRGLPGDALSVIRDADNRIASLRYVDSTGVSWLAKIRRYELLKLPATGNDLSLPSLITAKSERYSVRIVLRNWKLQTEAAVPKVHESHKRLAIPAR
ncbi:MAG: lipoprotein insertase outer membrane protein LolB [Granulosicoccus sp.]